MRTFLAGANVALCLVAALFFLRFLRHSRDRLYGYFALAFLLLGVNGAALASVPAHEEARTFVYGVRLLAFLVILAGIADKNRVQS